MNDFEDIEQLENDELLLKLSLGMNNPRQFYYHIYVKRTNVIVGNCGIRLEKNDENYYLGNIEYEISTPYRGNNYAYKACLLLTRVAAKYEANDLVITANPKNLSSIKTIKKLKVSFVEVARVPRKNVLYKQGDRYVAIYKWNLNEEKENVK